MNKLLNSVRHQFRRYQQTERSIRRGRDGMVVGFTTTCAISAHHHQRCEFESRSWRDILDATLCDKVCGRSVVFPGYSGFLHQ